jgi:hypothetical protein
VDDARQCEDTSRGRSSATFANPADVIFIPPRAALHHGFSVVRFFPVILLLVLAGCSYYGEPSQADLREQWNEQNIYPANYKGDVVAFIHSYLNNPGGIRNAAITRPQVKRAQGDPGDRYMVCVRYNARKSDGSYAGMTETVATFRAGKFERFIDPMRGDLQRQAAARIVQDLCKDAAYEPFPELQRLKR